MNIFFQMVSSSSVLKRFSLNCPWKQRGRFLVIQTAELLASDKTSGNPFRRKHSDKRRHDTCQGPQASVPWSLQGAAYVFVQDPTTGV